MAKKQNRFQALRELRKNQYQQEQVLQPTPVTDEKKLETLPPAVIEPQNSFSTTSAPKPDVNSKGKGKMKKKGPGRPPGRRSDPDYTQISAYIPLELLLSVQDELAKERRKKRERTARPVSDLIEELLKDWLKK